MASPGPAVATPTPCRYPLRSRGGLVASPTAGPGDPALSQDFSVQGIPAAPIYEPQTPPPDTPSEGSPATGDSVLQRGALADVGGASVVEKLPAPSVGKMTRTWSLGPGGARVATLGGVTLLATSGGGGAGSRDGSALNQLRAGATGPAGPPQGVLSSPPRSKRGKGPAPSTMHAAASAHAAVAAADAAITRAAAVGKAAAHAQLASAGAAGTSRPTVKVEGETIKVEPTLDGGVVHGSRDPERLAGGGPSERTVVGSGTPQLPTGNGTPEPPPGSATTELPARSGKSEPLAGSGTTERPAGLSGGPSSGEMPGSGGATGVGRVRVKDEKQHGTAM